MRDPTPIDQLGNFEPFRCDLSNISSDGKFKNGVCNHANVCNLRHKSGGTRFMVSKILIKFKIEINLKFCFLLKRKHV